MNIVDIIDELGDVIVPAQEAFKLYVSSLKAKTISGWGAVKAIEKVLAIVIPMDELLLNVIDSPADLGNGEHLLSYTQYLALMSYAKKKKEDGGSKEAQEAKRKKEADEAAATKAAASQSKILFLTLQHQHQQNNNHRDEKEEEKERRRAKRLEDEGDKDMVRRARIRRLEENQKLLKSISLADRQDKRSESKDEFDSSRSSSGSSSSDAYSGRMVRRRSNFPSFPVENVEPQMWFLTLSFWESLTRYLYVEGEEGRGGGAMLQLVRLKTAFASYDCNGFYRIGGGDGGGVEEETMEIFLSDFVPLLRNKLNLGVAYAPNGSLWTCEDEWFMSMLFSFHNEKENSHLPPCVNVLTWPSFYSFFQWLRKLATIQISSIRRAISIEIWRNVRQKALSTTVLAMAARRRIAAPPSSTAAAATKKNASKKLPELDMAKVEPSSPRNPRTSGRIAEPKDGGSSSSSSSSSSRIKSDEKSSPIADDAVIRREVALCILRMLDAIDPRDVSSPRSARSSKDGGGSSTEHTPRKKKKDKDSPKKKKKGSPSLSPREHLESSREEESK